jgi:hypothetical protein
VVGLYGYTVYDVDLGVLPDQKPSAVIKMHKIQPRRHRTIVQRTLGCHVEGHALPHPSPDCPDTMKSGVQKRFASLPPKADMSLLGEFKGFVRKYCEEHLVPLSPLSDVSVLTWLKHTRYTEARKRELLQCYLENPVLTAKHFLCKGFMKDETYVTWKHARGINSRHDRFKCEIGPYAKLIEEQVYKLHHFIKHVPVADRPRVIKERLYSLGREYFASDYTAFEALFTRELMDACEFELYDYMTQYLPTHEHFMSLVRDVLGGTNTLVYKFFTVELEATRMSGEMTTSLGNGWTNLMAFLFVAYKSGCEVDGFVEGDDGVFALLKGEHLDDALFESLGLRIKLERHTDLCSASFCGIIFDPDDCINVTDPREVLAGFGWTTNLYLNASLSTRLNLLRAKSLSYAYQYPGCPIIADLAEYGLRMTRGRDIRHFVSQKWQTNQWEREQVLGLTESRIPRRQVGMSTRLLVERKYGITVEVQLSIEHYLQSLQELVPLNLPCFDLIAPQEWRDYFSRFTAVTLDQNPPAFGTGPPCGAIGGV